jgi:hypothetical protein
MFREEKIDSIIGAFNTHFLEFLQDIQKVFPQNNSIRMAKNSTQVAINFTPKLLIIAWYKYVVIPYLTNITNGDITFFTDKDYNTDLSTMEDKESISSIIKQIDELRDPIRQMDPDNQAKSMKYMQNLTKLTQLYYGN